MPSRGIRRQALRVFPVRGNLLRFHDKNFLRRRVIHRSCGEQSLRALLASVNNSGIAISRGLSQRYPRTAGPQNAPHPGRVPHSGLGIGDWRLATGDFGVRSAGLQPALVDRKPAGFKTPGTHGHDRLHRLRGHVTALGLDDKSSSPTPTPSEFITFRLCASRPCLLPSSPVPVGRPIIAHLFKGGFAVQKPVKSRQGRQKPACGLWPPSAGTSTRR